MFYNKRAYLSINLKFALRVALLTGRCSVEVFRPVGGGGAINGWMDDTLNGFLSLFFCTHGQNAIALAKSF